MPFWGIIRSTAAKLRLFLILLGLLGLLIPARGSAEENQVDVLSVKGVINPIVAGYIGRGINTAERDGAQCLVIELDTPGGLDVSMREIIQAIVRARVPVVAYVAPAGARAASAGTFIVMAAHIAAMAPNTNIGAAHPVSISGEVDKTMAEKVTNDAVALIKGLAEQRGRNAAWAEQAVRQSVSVTAKEALDLRVIDLTADDLTALLNKIDGREVILPQGSVTLHMRGARLNWIEMNFIENLLHTISDPNIAYILLILGINGLIFELANPGAIFPGVIGAICLILAFLALGTLPLSHTGLALIILAFVLFVTDLFVTAHGILTAGGIVALLLGSLLLINSPAPYIAISTNVIIAVVGFTGLFFAFVIGKVIRAQRQRAVTGYEGLVGARGVARTDLKPEGVVFVQGEHWEALSEEGEIGRGAPVQVVGVKGLKVIVRKA
ncbi:MAG: nodulation protein NfeD [Chloroflexi bacterium]|nr:nodulation protein NfeD [Chloroflexota bacterium]